MIELFAGPAPSGGTREYTVTGWRPYASVFDARTGPASALGDCSKTGEGTGPSPWSVVSDVCATSAW